MSNVHFSFRRLNVFYLQLYLTALITVFLDGIDDVERSLALDIVRRS